MSAETLQTTTALEPLEDVARRELGETPAVKQAALNELRRLISDEPSLHCPMDDVFLVRFLRARKYDTQAAFKNVKKYFKVRTEHPEIFEDFTPSGIPFDDVCRKHRLATLSRHRDQMGRMAMLIKAGAWNTEISSLNDFIRVAFVIIEHILTWEDFVIRGFVIIVDLKGLSIYHLAHFTPSVTRTVFSLLQDCMPVRLKGLYYINSPPIFDVFFGITKLFLSAKLLKRVRLFGHDLEELRQLVPDDVIPEENGGTNESYDYDQLERELQSEESYFQRLRSYGYRDTPTKTETESNGLLTDEVSGHAEANDMSAVVLEPAASLEAIEDIALRELGETPKIKQTALNELRQLISGEPSLHCPTDDAFLVKFLRARKYDTQATFKIVKKYFKDCMPMRLKGIYVINNPPIFDFIYAVIKMFLKAKLLKRIRLFGYDLKELHQLVPDDVIPEENGGTNESYDYDPLERELESEEGYFQELNTYAYHDKPRKTVHFLSD
ncbi:hypothetical protein MTO96_014907 [Rhipicephalus appendiculatus]